MNGLISRLGDEWTDKQTNQRTDERKSPCVLQDLVPFGAAAQKGEKTKGHENKMTRKPKGKETNKRGNERARKLRARK